MPSNIDFDEKDENEKSFINPEKKLPEMGKALVIGSEMKAYRIAGKAISKEESHMAVGALVVNGSSTHPIHLYDHKSSGFKKLWESIVGYSKREIMVQDGHIYILERKGNALFVESLVPLSQLFKLFVDPEDETLRLVLRGEGQDLHNLDFQPENFIQVLGMLSHELNAIGLALAE
jgi:hypothetical protein